MTLHSTPEDHAADPPAGWRVVKVADRCWHLDSALGGTIDYFTTKRDAEAARQPGSHLARQYDADGRWFAGETPTGHNSYAQVVAGRRKVHDRWHASKPDARCQFCASADTSAAAAALTLAGLPTGH